jgi:hypothetical protein
MLRDLIHKTNDLKMFLLSSVIYLVVCAILMLMCEKGEPSGAIGGCIGVFLFIGIFVCFLPYYYGMKHGVVQ